MSKLIFTALTIAVPGSFTVGALGKNVAKLRICELVDASLDITKNSGSDDEFSTVLDLKSCSDRQELGNTKFHVTKMQK